MNDSLFTGDKNYDEQEEKALELDLLADMQKFVGFRVLNSCQNCYWRVDDKCHVLEKYNKKTFAVVDLGKCKHWKKTEE